MRKLPLLPILALLALFAFAAPAPALTVPEILSGPAGAEVDEPEAEDEVEVEEGEGDSEETCELAEEEDCEEAEAIEECILEDATARVTPRPSNNTVLLTIRYEAVAPAAVAIDARLKVAHGRLRLGANHAHFRRAGVFREGFSLSEREMERALGAREFEVGVRALNAPRYCQLDLSGAPRRAKRSLRAGAPGRSGDRGPTRDR